MFWQWLIFWKENIHKGWEFGDGLFGFIIELSLIIGGGLLFLKWIFRKINWAEKWKEWEDHLMKGAFVVFALSFLIATFFIAPFLQYEEVAHPKVSEALPIPSKKPILALITSPVSIPIPQIQTKQTQKLPDETQSQPENYNLGNDNSNSIPSRFKQLADQNAAKELADKSNCLYWWNLYLPYYRHALISLNNQLVIWGTAHGDGISEPSNYGQCLATNIDDTIGKFDPTHIGMQKNTNMFFNVTVTENDQNHHRKLIINSSLSSLEMEGEWGQSCYCKIHIKPSFDDYFETNNANARVMIDSSLKELVDGQYYALTNN